ncbi:dTDP-4-dehydrorhamnose reductase [Persephonella hydrogeniphila]|uniref:dTDP-4-dehydrorhamnose reductase n=1 Tax=Persephonella hydrogeniphila TaxID=198703 RepID=A0A285N9K3_9AQUI|nr:dTDP-4-dehydrorhamnose reductase [Persephonella hydrogeniphila]SNZ06145.1 dTDP-4-dehydrorhamnose reductase [Persephonella hydrogeniphila]
MKYLIFGKNGQLGEEFQKALSNKNMKFLALSHKECDISDLKKLREIFESYKPDVVINCAAYNYVDKAETDFWDSYKTNALGVRNLSYLSKIYNCYFITYSTDYVFDGTKEEGLYTEGDTPNPLNEYGKSKLTGEKWVFEEDLNKYLILRTSWVYGEGKQNFIYKVLQWVERNSYLKIAYDEISVPTSTRTIVEVTLKAIKQELSGLYHLTNSGYASRYEWAKKILELKGIKKFIYPVSKDIFDLPAKRPKFSAMDNGKISSELGIEILRWDEELEALLKYKN